MKLKYVFLISLAVSAVVAYFRHVPTPTYPVSKATPALYAQSEDKATPAPRLAPLDYPTPTPSKGSEGKGKASKGKATPTLAPALSHKDSLAGRMQRADRMRIPIPTGIQATTTVQGSTPTPVQYTPVQYTPAPRPSHLDRGSVTGSRRVLPVFSLRKNGTLRYNGKDVR